VRVCLVMCRALPVGGIAHWAKCNIIVQLSNIFEGVFLKKN
jgi:hypothetical protein